MTIASTFLSLLTFLRFSIPSIEVSEWKRLNRELKEKLSPLNQLINNCTNSIDLSTIWDKISLEILNFCKENKELFAEEANHTQNFVNHKNKAIHQLEAYKRKLRKKAFKNGANPEKRKLFH